MTKSAIRVCNLYSLICNECLVLDNWRQNKSQKKVCEIYPSLYVFILPTSNLIWIFYTMKTIFNVHEKKIVNVHELSSSSIFVKTSTKISRSFLKSSSWILVFWTPGGSTVKLSVFICSLRIISSTLENLSLARQLWNQKSKLESRFMKSTSLEELERRNQRAKLYNYHNKESSLRVGYLSKS